MKKDFLSDLPFGIDYCLRISTEHWVKECLHVDHDDPDQESRINSTTYSGFLSSFLAQSEQISPPETS